MVPGVPEAAMRGASIEQADSFAHGDVALHILAALGALVQLVPAAFRRLVVAHWHILHRTEGSRESTTRNGSHGSLRVRPPVDGCTRITHAFSPWHTQSNATARFRSARRRSTESPEVSQRLLKSREADERDERVSSPADGRRCSATAPEAALRWGAGAVAGPVRRKGLSDGIWR